MQKAIIGVFFLLVLVAAICIPRAMAERQRQRNYAAYLQTVILQKPFGELVAKDGEELKIEGCPTIIMWGPYRSGSGYYVSLHTAQGEESHKFRLNQGPSSKSIAWGDVDLSLLKKDLRFVLHLYDGKYWDRPATVRYTVSRKDD